VAPGRQRQDDRRPAWTPQTRVRPAIARVVVGREGGHHRVGLPRVGRELAGADGSLGGVRGEA
jgi:hypothetical protein